MGVVELVPGRVPQPEAPASDVVPADGEQRSVGDREQGSPEGRDEILAVVPLAGHVGTEGAERVAEGRRAEDREHVAARARGARSPRARRARPPAARRGSTARARAARSARAAGAGSAPAARACRGSHREGLRPRRAAAACVGAGWATARAVASPTTISVPTGRPRCSAMSRMRRPVTALSAERGSSDVERVDPSTSSVPQSASGSWTLPVGVTAWPRTTRPVIVDVPTSPVAPAGPAAAPARTVTDSATTSPASAVTASARIVPSADDEMPGCAVVVARRGADAEHGPVGRERERAAAARRRRGGQLGAGASGLTGDAHLRDERGGVRVGRVGCPRCSRGEARDGSAEEEHDCCAGAPHDRPRLAPAVPDDLERELRRDGEEQHPEEAPQQGLVDPGCDLDARAPPLRWTRPRPRAPVAPSGCRTTAGASRRPPRSARSRAATSRTPPPGPGPSSTSVGTNRIPPPTPKIPESRPAPSPSPSAAAIVHALIRRSARLR